MILNHPSRRDTLSLMAATFGAAVGLPVAGAIAQEASIIRRIDLAGRQRMLTQRISRASLFMALEVDRDGHLDMLKQSHGLYGRSINALRAGDAELGLEPETNEAVLSALSATEAIWSAFDLLIQGILDRGSVSESEVNGIARLNPTLLDLSNKVVTELTHLRGDRGLDLGKSVALNVAARQRMLTQKLAKEAAQIVIGFEPELSQKNLRGTRDIFEASHSALLNGVASIQLPPPTDAVRAKLLEADEIWIEYRGTIDRIIETGIASSYDLTSISVQSDELLVKMNEAVKEF